MSELGVVASEADGKWEAHVTEIPDVSAEGDTREAALVHLIQDLGETYLEIAATVRAHESNVESLRETLEKLQEKHRREVDAHARTEERRREAFDRLAHSDGADSAIDEKAKEARDHLIETRGHLNSADHT